MRTRKKTKPHLLIFYYLLVVALSVLAASTKFDPQLGDVLSSPPFFLLPTGEKANCTFLDSSLLVFASFSFSTTDTLLPKILSPQRTFRARACLFALRQAAFPCRQKTLVKTRPPRQRVVRKRVIAMNAEIFYFLTGNVRT